MPVPVSVLFYLCQPSLDYLVDFDESPTAGASFYVYLSHFFSPLPKTS